MLPGQAPALLQMRWSLSAAPVLVGRLQLAYSSQHWLLRQCSCKEQERLKAGFHWVPLQAIEPHCLQSPYIRREERHNIVSSRLGLIRCLTPPGVHVRTYAQPVFEKPYLPAT